MKIHKNIKLQLLFVFFSTCFFTIQGQLSTLSIQTDAIALQEQKEDTIQQKHDTFHSYLAASSIATSNQHVPLCMRSLQHGGLPLSGLSGSVFVGVYKNYYPERNDKLLDWGAGFSARGNVGNKVNGYITEAYARLRFSFFQITAGRTTELIGLVDSSLSTGAFAVSGNALGIPKVELSTRGYWDFPFTKGLIAFQGTFAHGWMGERLSTYTLTKPHSAYTTYLHQKTLYGRLGKPPWKIHLYGGFSHLVEWGNEQKMYVDYGINKWETYKHVIFGKAYGNSQVPVSKVGNHLGSIDQGITLKIKNLCFFGYHQFFYDVGALAKLANATDGIWGLSVTNRKNTNRDFMWEKILIEMIFSKSQGGEIDGPVRPSPTEDYYNNPQYIEGWTNADENIGNVLFTSKKYIREDLPQPKLYIVNNRLSALHTAFTGTYKSIELTTKLTFSRNFGNYSNYPAHRGFGSDIIYHDPPYFGEVFQFNGYLEASYSMKNGMILNLGLAADYGELLYKSVGGFLKIVKKW